jgi:hypothetical protein
MKQLLAVNSQQLTVPFVKPHPKAILPPSNKLPATTALKNIGIFKSKKRIKRVEHMMEGTPTMGVCCDAESRPMGKNELKQYVIGQLTNINAHQTPLTMKISQNHHKSKVGALRCSTEGQ